MSAEEQTSILADYIMEEIPGEPSRSEGAGECAVRLLTRYRKAMRAALDELGVPDGDYPAPVVAAVAHLNEAMYENEPLNA